MKRKTINIDSVKNHANTFLASDNFTEKEKSGIIYLLEKILNETGQYNGYSNNNDEGIYNRKYW